MFLDFTLLRFAVFFEDEEELSDEESEGVNFRASSVFDGREVGAELRGEAVEEARRGSAVMRGCVETDFPDFEEEMEMLERVSASLCDRLRRL